MVIVNDRTYRVVTAPGFHIGLNLMALRDNLRPASPRMNYGQFYARTARRMASLCIIAERHDLARTYRFTWRYYDLRLS